MSSSDFWALQRRLLGHWLLAHSNRGGTRHLGILMSVQDDAEGKAQLSGFTQALAGLGWIEGGLKRVAMLFNPDSAPGHGTYYSRDFDAAAKLSKLELVSGRASNDVEIESVITSLSKAPNGGLVIMPDFFMFNHIEPITSPARENKVPAIYPWKFVVTKNAGLLSFGPGLNDIVRRGAAYIDRVLRGEKPADFSVQVPVKFEMAINVKTAGALSLAVPPSMLLQADEVVE